MGTLNNIPVYIISLDRAVERREYMKQLLANLGFEATFVSAVDGRRLTAEQRDRYRPDIARRIYGCEMSDNEIACYLSHYSIYERIRDEGVDTALIIEDDIDAVADLKAIVEELVQIPRGGWEVVRLMSSKSSVQSPRTRRAFGTPVGKVGNRDLCRLQSGILGGCAYVIRKSAAEAMIQYARTIFMPIDQTLDRYWENGIVPYVLRPMPVWHSSAFQSEIGVRGRAAAPRPKLATVASRRVQRVHDALNKRVFWLVYRFPMLGPPLSWIGLRSAQVARYTHTGPMVAD